MMGTEQQLIYFSEQLRQITNVKHKIVIAGNHDWFCQTDPNLARQILSTECIYLNEEETIIDGVRFWGSPWTPEFCSWAFNIPKGEEN